MFFNENSFIMTVGVIDTRSNMLFWCLGVVAVGMGNITIIEKLKFKRSLLGRAGRLFLSSRAS